MAFRAPLEPPESPDARRCSSPGHELLRPWSATGIQAARRATFGHAPRVEPRRPRHPRDPQERRRRIPRHRRTADESTRASGSMAGTGNTEDEPVLLKPPLAQVAEGAWENDQLGARPDRQRRRSRTDRGQRRHGLVRQRPDSKNGPAARPTEGPRAPVHRPRSLLPGSPAPPSLLESGQPEQGSVHAALEAGADAAAHVHARTSERRRRLDDGREWADQSRIHVYRRNREPRAPGPTASARRNESGESAPSRGVRSDQGRPGPPRSRRPQRQRARRLRGQRRLVQEQRHGVLHRQWRSGCSPTEARAAVSNRHR